MSNAPRVLQIARREIGYSRWNDPQRGTKYGRWMASATGQAWYGNNNIAYCNMFTSYVLAHAGVGEPAPGRFAYVPYAINAYTKAGRRVWNVRHAKPGDLVCFDWNGDGVADHIGIVELNRGTHLQTIEGNTSAGVAGSQANGGLVARRTRAWAGVIAILRPAYKAGSKPTQPAKRGRLAVDGYLGSETVKAWQQVNRTPIDGVISGQASTTRPYHAGVKAAQYVAPHVAPGSQLIAAVQRTLTRRGYTVGRIDGQLGPQTIRALQARYKTPIDGKISSPSLMVKALQRALNKQLGR